jgi:hypothetical protein
MSTNNLNVCGELSTVVLPYYIDRIETWATPAGNAGIKAYGKAHPEDLNPPMDTPKVYVKGAFFDGPTTAQQVANLILHRLRFHTLKIEAYYDFNNLVRACRPYRLTHPDLLREKSKFAIDTFGKDWKYSRENIQKVAREIASVIPGFRV